MFKLTPSFCITVICLLLQPSIIHVMASTDNLISLHSQFSQVKGHALASPDLQLQNAPENNASSQDGPRDHKQWSLKAYEQAQNSSLYWGTYRPNLYFGTRTRSASSDAAALTGLMWFGIDDGMTTVSALRHTCELGDNMAGYGWKKHDGRTFGDQEVNDVRNNVQIRTQFLKSKELNGWTVRVSGSVLDSAEKTLPISMAYYIGLNSGSDGYLELLSPKRKGIEGPAIINGETEELGPFSLVMSSPASNQSPVCDVSGSAQLHMRLPDLQRTQFLGLEVDEGKIWQAKDFVRDDIQEHSAYLSASFNPDDESSPPSPFFFTLSNDFHPESNLAVLQRTFIPPFSFDISFIPREDDRDEKTIKSEVLSITGAFSKSLRAAAAKFEERFESTFHLKQKGFSKAHIQFAQFALSNMLGGIGYFQGNSLVSGENGQALQTPEQSLFATVPSRSFFPRGFLWDEGFHQILVSKWDLSMSVEILKSWTNLVQRNGWVAREQILGDEARSKVPSEFQVQNTEFGNPPTWWFLMRRISKQANFTSNVFNVSSPKPAQFSEIFRSSSFNEQIISGLLKKMELHFKWFRDSQVGDAPPGLLGYRWRGRTPTHILTSGLDDYPRAPKASPKELHLDLISWMAFIARSLGEIHDEHLKIESKDNYKDMYKTLIKSIEEIHWNPTSKTYCDVTVDSQGKKIFVDHKGYISLFPFLLGLISPDSPRLGATLDLMYNPNHLWSEFGLRSLSASDEFFGTNENYWRGPIWVNINYLALSSLKTNYVKVPGPYQAKASKIYKELRTNLITNIFKQFEKTNTIWEQYCPFTGEGKRSHPFTGWSALVVAIMSENYD